MARRKLFPGNQGAHYFDDPGEGFADGYAHLHFPSTPWRYNALLRPTTALSEAIRRDVETPWTGPRTRTVEAERLGRLRVRLALDGDVTVRVSGQRGAPLPARGALRGLGDRTHASRPALSSGSSGVASSPATACCASAARRLAGSGPLRLTVRYPG